VFAIKMRQPIRLQPEGLRKNRGQSASHPWRSGNCRKRSRNHVEQFGIGNQGDENEGHDKMNPPKDPVERLQILDAGKALK
jgi:hypothetical protein